MSSSPKDSKDSEKSLFELASHNFATIKETITYVDKTLFIKCVLTDTYEVVLLTAPRAFGKSTLMDMMKQFLLGKTRLFENLKICTEDPGFFSEHCRPHPVIHIDLVRVKGDSFADVKLELATAINRTFRQHAYLVKRTDDGTLTWTSEKIIIADRSVKRFERYYDEEKYRTLSAPDLVHSLEYLSEVLHTHYEEKVWILIDEYDAPAVGLVFQPWSDTNDTELVGALLQNFMGATLKSNNYRERSLIFACVRLAGAVSGDAGRVIKHYPFLSDIRYAPYLGFTDHEVEQLLKIPKIKATCGRVSLNKIRKWYDGYVVSGGSFKIFSSWSVLKLLEEADNPSAILKYSSFWIITGCITNLQELFANPLIRHKIEKLTSRDTTNNEIKIETVKSLEIKHVMRLRKMISLEFDDDSKASVDLFLQFLADNGYFNMLSCNEQKKDKKKTKTKGEKDAVLESNTTCILKIPNFEINQHIRELCYSEARKIINEYNLSRTFIIRYLNALKLILENTNEKAFVDLANAILELLSQSSPKITREIEVHHILYTLTYNCRYFVTLTEVQIEKIKAAKGLANTLDMLVMSKNVGILFEYKVNSMSVNEALKQIFAKKYYTIFDESNYGHISKKIYVSLAFNTEKKKVFITYQVGNEGESESVCSD